MPDRCLLMVPSDFLNLTLAAAEKTCNLGSKETLEICPFIAPDPKIYSRLTFFRPMACLSLGLTLALIE